MKPKEPQPKFGGDWPTLAAKFGYTIDRHAQDWPIEVAETHRLQDYLRVYEHDELSDLARTSLMEMILEATEMKMRDSPKAKEIISVQLILQRDFAEHSYLIHKWCDWNNDDLSESYDITPLMRNIWQANK